MTFQLINAELFFWMNTIPKMLNYSLYKIYLLKGHHNAPLKLYNI